MKVLLLQGPVGEFFRYLDGHLRRIGFTVRRIAFNGGDVAFALGTDFEIARLAGTTYEAYFEALLDDWRPDAIVLFGDERPIHRAAVKLARAKGIAVWCFEEGYVRPDHVTFEKWGNNANSPLMRTFDPARTSVSPSPAPRLSGQTFAMIRAAFIYFIAYRTTRAAFRGYVHHRERRLRDEFFFWWRTLLRRSAATRGDAGLLGRLTSGTYGRFFLVALQIHDDLQLTSHGRGWRTRPFVQMVLDSFVRAAPADCRLVVKAHPLDVGYGNNRKNIHLDIVSRGLDDRVDFLQSGPLGPIVQNALGLVTINSTAGFGALRHFRPVITFGNAIYQGEGMAVRADGPGDLDAFWNAPRAIDVERVRCFLSHVIREALVEGSFYLPATWPKIADHVARAVREDREAVGGDA